MKVRKEFIEMVIKMANLREVQEADASARAFIALTKTIIDEDLSGKIAEVSPPDIRKGWETIPGGKRKSIW